MRFEPLHPADQIVMIMRRIYQYGMTTTSGGNLSIRDSNGDIWITPSGVDKGALSRDDIIRVTKEGKAIGPHRPSVELPFHLGIYRARPDLAAILHAHPPTLVAFSIARRIPSMRLVPDVSSVCGGVAMAEYALPGSERLGENIARRFAEGSNTVMMENHGCVCAAKDLSAAFMAFETLDFSGRMEIYARKLGTPRFLSDEQIALSGAQAHPKLDAFLPSEFSSEERAARQNICMLIHRAYDQRLFTSTQGTLSQRLEDGFLITPSNKDRKYLEAEDIVRIRGGMCEAGKTPSRSVLLHQAIYDAHPDIGSVIIAQPSAIMAFAVTDKAFDTRTIPESYVMLRDVKKLPFLCSVTEPARTAAAFSSRAPLVLIENQCVVITGDSLLSAFDRLEVLDYSARAVIDARDIAPLVMIQGKEVREIERAYHLR